MGEIIGTAGASLQNAEWGVSSSVASVGRIGEQYTAGELVGAAGRGAAVLHDLRVPIRVATSNIDHIVVSGARVTLIDSKHWRAGLYWTPGTSTRRWLTSVPHADKQGMRMAANAISGLLRRRNLPFEQTDPLTVIWSAGPINVRRYRPHTGVALTARGLQAWVQALAHEPADPRIVDALRPLVNQESPR